MGIRDISYMSECSHAVSLNFEFLSGYQTYIIYNAKFIWSHILRNVHKVFNLNFEFLNGYQNCIMYDVEFIWSHTFRTVHKVLL
jgi:hypothetical protein